MLHGLPDAIVSGFLFVGKSPTSTCSVVNNCKVINGQSVAAQHRVGLLVFVDWEIKCSKRRIPEHVTPKIKMVETERR